MRPSKACLSCRVSKRGCHVKPGQAACSRCLSLGLACSFSGASGQVQQAEPRNIGPARPGSHSQSLTTDVSDGIRKDQRLSSDECLQAVGYYFSVIHDKHHSLFHQPSFEEKLRLGQVPDVIRYSMIALGARFLEVPPSCTQERRRRGDAYAEQAHKLLDLRVVSLPTVQACVLLGTLCFVEGQPAAEAIHYAAANRLALILDLPHRQWDTELDRQVGLRVWWSLYMIDIWSSSGLRLPRDLSFPDGVDLPSDEEYLQGLTSRSEHHRLDGRTSSSTGIWAAMTRLARIWAEIQRAIKSSVDEHMSTSALPTVVDALAYQLDAWVASLPTSLQQNTTNLARYASLGYGTSFAALHLGYHYYNEVLFFRFLSSRDHGGFVSARHYASRCTAAARSFCELLYTCEDTPGAECLYVMVGHMLTVTSAVCMHTLLFAEDASEVRAARLRLERNFGVLTRLQMYWDVLDRTLERLRAFHDACVDSIESSFRMDAWMLKFILEHGTSMPEKGAVLAEGEAQHEGNGVGGLAASDGNLREWYVRTFA